jgi:hypothetical protein
MFTLVSKTTECKRVCLLVLGKCEEQEQQFSAKKPLSKIHECERGEQMSLTLSHNHEFHIHTLLLLELTD